MRYPVPRVEDRPIWDIWLSMHHLPAMAIADELGIFEALVHEPATSAEIASRLGLNRRATDVLFSMLMALGLVRVQDGRHELTEHTQVYLLRESPFYWGPLLRTLGVLRDQREALMRALQATDDAAGVSPKPVPSKSWERGQMDRTQAEAVSRIMHCHSLPAAIGLSRSGHFEGVRRMLDVGGGSGCFSIAVAQHLPETRCTIMELPAVCEVAWRYIREGGVADRVDTFAADMFHEPWPTGHDAILLSNVFHDWPAQSNCFLAQRAHETLPAGGRILVHEMLLADDRSGPATTASFSMLMMFGTRGRQYSYSEVRQILGDAGFSDIRVEPGYGYFSLVTGVRR